ncbi:MAG: hypothetical protein ACI8RZ_005099 [Myxococcota bacterium]
MLLILLPIAHAEGLLGIDYVPAGRADLVALEEGQTSGTGVGEFDGVLSPPLTVWGGIINDRIAWLGGVSVAWQSSSTWAGSQRTTSRRGGVRLALDRRSYLVSPDPDTIAPWIQVGAYGIVPFAGEHSDAWNDDEAAAMDAVAAEARSRIGGAGLRFGGGVAYETASGLSLGARALVVAHIGWEFDESGQSASTAVRMEPAVTIGWRL